MDQLLKNLAQQNKDRIVQVGVFASGKGGDTKKQDDKLTVLEVAIFNEFGLGVPERSFIRAYVDANEKRIKEMCRVLALQVLAGKISQEQALELLGLKLVGEIQQRIADGIPPPNAPSTIKAKGSSVPLIDTGQLRSSITHRVL
jgi:hypothetical protein